MENSKTNPMNVPMAIVVAGLLIAGAIFLRGSASSEQAKATVPGTGASASPELSAITLRPIDGTDYMRGNPDANIVFVEFSDAECPFCKRFHTTMKQVMNDYGKAGQVAWVYRQYPIVQLHSRAPKESEALLCAGELGGNAKFWDYTDRVFETTSSNDSLDPAELPKIAGEVGLDQKKFTACLSSGKYKARVDSEFNDGATAGVNGTPHSVLVLKSPISETAKTTLMRLFEPYRDNQGQLPVTFSTDGLRVGMNGALPYPLVKSTIDTLLK